MSFIILTLRALRIEIIMVILLSASPYLHANLSNTGSVYSMNIDVSGTVVANGTCTFDNNNALQVDFNEVKLVTTGPDKVRLEGEYLRPMVSQFSCTGDTNGLLQMMFSGSSSSYETVNGTQVLAVDKGIVGVELLVNGIAQDMGKWFNVDQTTPPTLDAKLIQLTEDNSQHVVSGDPFTASGTLLIAFN